MTLVYILRGRNSISHVDLQGERYSIGEMHIPRGRRHSLYVCFLVLHRVCVLDMHISLCYCASLNACSDDLLFCYVIIVIIFMTVWCMMKLLTCFTSCLLDRNLPVTLYLSFYYLLYLEGLMCFVQVFQVPSASQLLIILKGRNFKHFQFILFKFYSI